ncbi:hypothetical protein HK098_000562 [Nowakowskiella sp. JEL0407]|nr:hypothetical protein HK098_000562 [Nowakowskiella sp. JEL0407]
MDEPKIPIIATVTAIHGLGEHIARYDEVFEKFAQNGIKVAGIDHRGHGRTLKQAGAKSSAGDLGKNFDQSLDDIHLVSEKIKLANIPHFVFGHSLGGLIALLYAKKYENELAGVISSGAVDLTFFFILSDDATPAIDPLRPQLLIAAGPYISYIAGSVIINNGLNVNDLSSSKEEVEKYANDPLNHPYITLGTGNAIFQGGKTILKEANNWKLSVLLTHSRADRITGFKGTQSFFDLLKNEDKQFKTWDDLKHESNSSLLS